MKISKEARRAARKLFGFCMMDGRLDEAKVRELVKLLATKKPRHYMGMLSLIEKLVRHEVEKSTVTIESAVALSEPQVIEIRTKIQSRFKHPLTLTQKITPSLIGGLRVKIGSNVWDGSVAARLQQLEVKN